MITEADNQFAQGANLLEQILGNKSLMLTMLTGSEKDKDAVMHASMQAVINISEAQQAFLKALIATLAREGYEDETDRRDAAIEIVRTPAAVDLLPSNQAVIFDAYLEALNQQTKENDPYSGSINSLLEAGVVLSPYFPQDDLSEKQLKNLFEQLSKEFTNREERQHIELFAEEILENLTIYGAQHARVKYWKKKKLKHQEIAHKIGTKVSLVDRLVERLIEDGELESRAELSAALDATVLGLMKQGFAKREIVRETDRFDSAIEPSIKRIIDRNEIDRDTWEKKQKERKERNIAKKGEQQEVENDVSKEKTGRKGSEERRQLDATVEELIRAGVKRREIMKRTGRTESEIDASRIRLRMQKRIPNKTGEIAPAQDHDQDVGQENAAVRESDTAVVLSVPDPINVESFLPENEKEYFDEQSQDQRAISTNVEESKSPDEEISAPGNTNDSEPEQPEQQIEDSLSRDDVGAIQEMGALSVGGGLHEPEVVAAPQGAIEGEKKISKKREKFDMMIRALKLNGFQTSEIIDLFGNQVDKWMLKRSVKYLEQIGVIEKEVPGKMLVEKIKKRDILDSKVRPLTGKGMSADLIAQTLGEPVEEIIKSQFRIDMRRKK